MPKKRGRRGDVEQKSKWGKEKIRAEEGRIVERKQNVKAKKSQENIRAMLKRGGSMDEWMDDV